MYDVLTTAGAISIGISGILVLLGVKSAYERKISRHKKLMLTASAFALLFLAIYGIKSALFEPKTYEGKFRLLYLSILWTHMVLATLNIPLVITTLLFALTRKFDKHKKIAKITAVVWISVAITGWAVFIFLQID